MLILARRKQETIHIGERIVITICSIEGRIVRVGIEAPPEEKILRGELVPGDGEPKTLEPKTLEPKTLEPKTLEPKTLEHHGPNQPGT